MRQQMSNGGGEPTHETGMSSVAFEKAVCHSGERACVLAPKPRRIESIDARDRRDAITGGLPKTLDSDTGGGDRPEAGNYDTSIAGRHGGEECIRTGGVDRTGACG